jgi:sugar/nucleoside kinase (ribokinase family)
VKDLNSEELVAAVESLPRPETITWVHCEGRNENVLRGALPRLRAFLPHAKFSLELEKHDRTNLLDLLQYIDVAFFSKQFYLRYPYPRRDLDFDEAFNGRKQSITPGDFFEALIMRGSRRKDRHRDWESPNDTTHVLSLGSKGAVAREPGYDEVREYARKVEVVDSTGAGDTLIAGYIWSNGKLRLHMQESLRVGVELATRKVAQEGFGGVWEGLQFPVNDLPAPEKDLNSEDED